MYCAAFIFIAGNFDERYFALDALIDAAAKATPGFLGQENWKSDDGQRINASYYWTSLDALKAFSNHPKHLEAKRQYQQWYQGFHVVISQVLRSYGDGKIAHLTPNERAPASNSTE